MAKRIFFLVMVCAFSVLFASATFGQANGSFSGTVTDKSGSLIVGATVRATAEGTGAARESKTDDAGHYLIPLLAATNYTLHV